MKTTFTKMEGLGNDYIYVNAFENTIEDPAAFAIRWSDRHTGIGSDGLIMICPSDKADFRMRMFNADGSEGKMCGNGIRCVGKFVHDKGLTAKTEIKVETLAGIKTLQFHLDAKGQVEEVTVDMGNAGVLAVGKTISAAGKDYVGTSVDMGNPHFVIPVEDAESFDVAGVGRIIEHDPYFPEGVNVEFCSKLPDGSIRMRVWERGSGITMACGTGACATAVAATVAAGTAVGEHTIRMDGGSLSIRYDAASGAVLMKGPAAFVFDGVVEND